MSDAASWPVRWGMTELSAYAANRDAAWAERPPSGGTQALTFCSSPIKECRQIGILHVHGGAIQTPKPLARCSTVGRLCLQPTRRRNGEPRYRCPEVAQ